MIIAPIIRAMTGLAGMPSFSMGMKEVCAAALGYGRAYVTR
jgi:hypothetical protein